MTHPDKMMASLIAVGQPMFLAVSVGDAKKQLEIANDDTSHDIALESTVAAVVEQFEHDTGRIMAAREYIYCLSDFPHRDRHIGFPVRGVVSVESIKYENADNHLKTFATTNYRLSKNGRSVLLNHASVWPSVAAQAEAVMIEFTAGHAAAAAVPKLWRQAVLLQVAHWFENREMMNEQSTSSMTNAYEMIVRRLARSSYP